MASPATDREIVRRHGLRGFVEAAWPQIEACDLILEPHIPLICAHLEAAHRGEIRDLVIAVPPGTSKSVVTSILWPAWGWTIDPTRKWMHTSYAEDLSLSFARRTLELISGEWYRARWPNFGVKGGGRASAGDFWLTSGGRRFSTMLRGVATGVHAHILVCDDPHKPSDLSLGGESAKAALSKDWAKWTGTFSSRHADAATFTRVVIAQRLHEDDVSGRMLQSPRTVSVTLPMEYVPERRCETRWGSDWRSSRGELLAPRRFPPEVIAAKKDPVTGMSRSDYASQMQQSPSPDEGGLFLREWFGRRWSVLPPELTDWAMFVDATFKASKDSDYVAIGVWARVKSQPYLVDITNARLTFSETLAEILRLKQTWPQIRMVGIEDKANGSAIIDVLSASVPGVVPLTPRGSKHARASACTPMLRGLPGVVFPQHHPEIGALIDQASNFPAGSHDDLVDMLSYALDYYATLSSRGSFLERMRGVELD